MSINGISRAQVTALLMTPDLRLLKFWVVFALLHLCQVETDTLNTDPGPMGKVSWFKCGTCGKVAVYCMLKNLFQQKVTGIIIGSKHICNWNSGSQIEKLDQQISTKMLTSQDTTYLFSGIPRNSKPMPSVLAWKRISLAEKYGHFHWQWSFRLFQFITSGDVFRLTLYGSPQCLESELENLKNWPKNTKKKVTYSYLALQSQTAPTFQVEVSLLQPPPTSNNNLFTFKIYRVQMKS